MAKHNAWLKHMAKTRKAHPNIKDVGKLAKLAKKSYKPQKGGSEDGEPSTEEEEFQSGGKRRRRTHKRKRKGGMRGGGDEADGGDDDPHVAAAQERAARQAAGASDAFSVAESGAASEPARPRAPFPPTDHRHL